MLTVEIPQDQGIFLRLPLMTGKIQERVFMAINKLAIELQSYIVKEKLSGQVLNKVTGNLQQSIQQKVVATPTEITATVFSAGDVKYAAIHEYGGTYSRYGRLAGDYTVRVPERSYMRSSLRDFAEKIKSDIQQAAVLGIRGE